LSAPKPRNLTPADFEAVLADLGLDGASLRFLDPAPPATEGRRQAAPAPGNLMIGPVGTGLEIPTAARLYRERWDALLPPDGWALIFLKDPRPDEDVARWRNALWPWLHVVAFYRCTDGKGAERETLQGKQRLEGRVDRDGVLLVARRREYVLSPTSTVAKFDANASGWNGEPGKPGYAHYRWMRRYVGRFAVPQKGARVLDFGCGAGWVGIEAALAAPGTVLRAFDPSPEMVRLAGENARASAVADFEARTGFGEDPPYPAAGEAPFDVVYSSGVLSFSPDVGKWLDGLARCVRPGGVLVVGDIHRESSGMQKRRAARPLLPARELNARTGAEVTQSLVKRGFQLEAQAGYQLSWPVPQLMHWSDERGGALSPLLLAMNRAAAGKLGPNRFDSWVLRLRAPGKS
jgi:2-polyprenyl-3-methyl-5-hydroxy-6-metoxy-1,4-benzoquinol methylase